MLNNSELENIVGRVAREQSAAGVLMLIITRNDRAEIIAALADASLREKAKDVPALLRQLADEVESGGGVPTGRHMQTL